MRFKAGDRVLVFDLDVQEWRYGLVLKVREHRDKDINSWLELFPLILPDEGAWCYYVQYIDEYQIEEDDVTGVYLEVTYAHDNDLIIPDTPLARALYLGE